jgi:DNA-binding MarR family transcriptional regulator
MVAKQDTIEKHPDASDQRSVCLEGITGYLADPRARDFDRLVYERVRLGILSALAVNKSLTFSELKKLLRTSDGNLSVHARKLEEADYVTCTKFFKGRVPRTEYSLSPKGRRALERYLDHMEALIQATRS